MIEQLYVARGDEEFGPFSAAQLRRLAATGQLRPTDTLWQEGMEEPVLVTRVKNLFPAPGPPGPPAEAPAPAAEGPPATPAAPSTAVEPAPEVLAAGTGDATAPPSPGAPASTSPEQAGTTEKPPRREPERPQTRRAFGVRGAVIFSQDGYRVQYRKKCVECGFEDACRSTMLIAQGTTRANFFCPKCRKSREVVIQGNVQ